MVGAAPRVQSAANTQVYDPWPQFRRTANGTSHTPISYVHINDKRPVDWVFQMNGVILSSPVIDRRGVIFIGSRDNNLYAVRNDGSKGSPPFMTKGDIISSAAISDDGTVYVGSWDHKLHSFRGKDNFPLNVVETHRKIWSSPSIGPDGTVYTSSADGYLYAYSADLQNVLGKIATSSYVEWSSPAIDYARHIMYTGSEEGTLYAIYLGQPWYVLWKFAAGGFIKSSPAIARNGDVIFGCWDQHVYSVSYNGTLNWKFKTGGWIFSSPSINDVTGTIYIGSTDKYLYALRPNGALQWRYPTRGSIVATPSIDSVGRVYVGSFDKYVHVIDTQQFDLCISSREITDPKNPKRTVIVDVRSIAEEAKQKKEAEEKAKQKKFPRCRCK
jgi:outer membrane protein assembly factor BamB